MKALVIGANGFLGSHLRDELIKKLGEENVYKLVRTFLPDQDLVRNQHACDFTNYFELNRSRGNILFQKEKEITHIFHCAVYFTPQHNSPDDLLYNEILNMNIVRFWKEKFPKAKLITFGTDACYSDESKEHYELQYLEGRPNSNYYYYALSKRNLYHLVYHYHLHNESLDFIHFPLISLFGPGFKEKDDHLIHAIIRKIYFAKNNKNYIPTLFGDGLQIREVTFIDDVVENIMNLSFIDTKPFGILNLGSENKFTIKHYTMLICEIMDYDFQQVIFDQKKTTGLDSKYLDNSRVQDELEIRGIKFASSDITTSLKKTIDYFYANVKTL